MDNVSAVKEKINIIELIGGYIELKRAGRNWKAMCPFHNEKTPSFMVSEELQRYRCFGCGKSGDIFNFVMEFEGLEFSEALKLLADKAGVQLKEYESGKSAGEKDLSARILRMNEAAAKFYRHILLKHEVGARAREYLKGRGCDPAEGASFAVIGYAPDSWNSLANFLQKEGFRSAEMETAGLVRLRKDGTPYDLFRGRLMFPLIDHLDRVIGFSGRALKDDQQPKYMNSPETPIFHKEKFLYGLNLSKSYIRQKKEAIVVEGQFDMLTPFMAGIKNIVASGGTALTPAQVSLINRYAESIVLIFDNDVAGIEAGLRGTEVIKNAGINIKIARLPEGIKDPDEAVTKDKRILKSAVKNALPLWDYYFYYAQSKYDLSQVFERKKASGFLLGKINQIDDEVIKAKYVKKFAVLFEIDEPATLSELGKNQKQSDKKFSTSFSAANITKTDYNNGLSALPAGEVYLLSLLTKATRGQLPIYIAGVDEEYFNNESTRGIFAALSKEVNEVGKLDIKAFYDKLGNIHPEHGHLIEKIHMLPKLYASNEGENEADIEVIETDRFDAEITLAIRRLKLSFLKRKLNQLSRAIRQAEAASDMEKVEALQAEVKEISSELQGV